MPKGRAPLYWAEAVLKHDLLHVGKKSLLMGGLTIGLEGAGG